MINYEDTLQRIAVSSEPGDWAGYFHTMQNAEVAKDTSSSIRRCVRLGGKMVAY